MMTTLRPIQGVNCPSLKRLVAVTECEDCECLIELRRPWRGFIVKCSVEGESDSVTVEYG